MINNIKPQTNNQAYAFRNELFAEFTNGNTNYFYIQKTPLLKQPNNDAFVRNTNPKNQNTWKIIATVSGLVIATAFAIKNAKFKNIFHKMPKDFVKLTKDEIKYLKTQNKLKPKEDLAYSKKLYNGLFEHLNTSKRADNYRLNSIVGANELKSLLKNLKPEHFSTGKNLENTKNGTFRVNLHMHTDFSDGKMKVSELLEQSVKYADNLYSKYGEKFILTITDHETLESSKEAVKLIAQNPMKYKNIKFIPGMEKGFLAPTPYSIYGNPTEVSEFVAYSINPFCPKLNDFISTMQNNRKNLVKLILKEAHTSGITSKLHTIEETGLIGKEHPKSLMLDIQWIVSDYLKKVEPTKQEQIINLCKKYSPNCADNKISFPTEYKTEHTMKEVIDVIRESKDGFLGFAHPVFLTQKGFTSSESILKEFKNLGKDIAYAAEINYPKIHYSSIQDYKIEEIHNICKKLNLISTGGLDNHSSSIFH